MSTNRTIEHLAYTAFREGRVTPELQAFATDQIRRRGIRPAIDRALADIERAFGVEGRGR